MFYAFDTGCSSSMAPERRARLENLIVSLRSAKTAGNEHFKHNDLHRAIEAYSVPLNSDTMDEFLTKSTYWMEIRYGVIRLESSI